MQQWERLYSYINDYWYLVYKYYADVANACLATYYNLDKENSVYDGEKILGGSYEILGDLSGLRWKKILLFPCFFVEEVSPTRDLSEKGMLKPASTSIVFPSVYGVEPYTHDYVKFHQELIQPTKDIHPLYEVTGVDLTTTGDVTFYKAKLESSKNTVDEIEKQLSYIYAFHEPTKKIYSLNIAIFLSRLIEKMQKTGERIDRYFFDKMVGMYLNGH